MTQVPLAAYGDRIRNISPFSLLFRTGRGEEPKLSPTPALATAHWPASLLAAVHWPKSLLAAAPLPLGLHLTAALRS
jgi:hypothetical protein